MNERLCLMVNDGAKTLLACPMVAKVRLVKELDDVIKPRQVIAYALRLGVYYDLISPLEESMVITKKAPKTSLFFNADYLTPLYEYSLGKPIFEGQKGDKEEAAEKAAAFLSPMDGMFYLSPSPKSPPFIAIGQEIAPKDTVGIIEVMKCFYPVIYTGTKRIIITKIDVSMASPVSLGQALFHFDNVG